MRKVMSRRSALAAAASIAVVHDVHCQDRPQIAMKAKPNDDPAVLVAERCKKAQALVTWADRHFIRTGDGRLLQRAEAVLSSLEYELIETPARTLAGVRAKLEEQFPEETDLSTEGPAPDMEAYAIQLIYADLKRLDAVA